MFQSFDDNKDILESFNNNEDRDYDIKGNNKEEYKEDLPFDESFANSSFINPCDLKKKKNLFRLFIIDCDDI